MADQPEPTMEDLKKQLQVLSDNVQLAINQRNNAQNEGLQMGAEILALRREVEALKKAPAMPPEAPPMKANGRAVDAEVVASA